MKPYTSLCLCIILAGCVERVGPGPQPKPSVPTPATATDIKANDLFEALAQAVERGDIETTDKLLKVTNRAMRTAGVKAPEGYDTTMKQFMEGNLPLTEALQRDAAAKLRGFKT